VSLAGDVLTLATARLQAAACLLVSAIEI